MVVVEESSISDSGVYNKQSNTISWNITKIDASEEVKVSYKAIAPKSADGKELIGNSYITSDQVTTRVYSNNTIVTLDKIVEIIDNPNTGMHMLYIPNTNIGIPISFLFIIIMIICISLVVFKNKFMKKSMLK
jgi:high-affinity K+ transport system ATPase subunit B